MSPDSVCEWCAYLSWDCVTNCKSDVIVMSAQMAMASMNDLVLDLLYDYVNEGDLRSKFLGHNLVRPTTNQAWIKTQESFELYIIPKERS